MKKLPLILASLWLSIAPAAAQTLVPNLGAAGAVSDTDLMAIYQGASPLKKVTGAQLKLYAGQTAVRKTTTTSEALQDTDRNKLVTFDNSSPVACTIAQAGSGGLFDSTWAGSILNVNTGTVTCTAGGTSVFFGGGSSGNTLTLTAGQGCDLYSDGSTGYRAQCGKFGSGAPTLNPWLQPGYLSGKYYLPYAGSATAGSAITAGSIRLIPFMVSRAVTISELATRVTTASAGGNFQMAVYAANTSTLRPTGNALASTASISTTSTGALTLALSGNVALSPNVLYWAAINCDNATAAFLVLSPSNIFASAMIGSATLGNVLVSGAQFFGGLSVAQAFGTWPDLTSASFTEVTNPGTIPAIAFKAL